MIYTVTFNPSLDYIVSVDSLKLNAVNRTKKEQMVPGGKGINVSMVLSNLGLESCALGFIAGFTGDEIESRLGRQNIKTDFIKIASGQSRINAKIHSTDTEGSFTETEVNGMGPVVDADSLEMLFAKLDALKAGDILVLAGSVPSSMPADIYSIILEKFGGRDIRIVVDATGKLLTDTLKFHPFLVKPNNHELGAIFGAELKSREEVVPYAVKMRELGAENVLVSLGGDGAVLASADGKIYSLPAPLGKVVNAVGSGDSMVAGFLTGLLEKDSYEYALRMGLCTGSASAFSEGMATKDEVMKLLEQTGF